MASHDRVLQFVDDFPILEGVIHVYHGAKSEIDILLFVCLSVSVSICVSLCVSVWVCLCLCLRLSLYLSLSLSASVLSMCWSLKL
jgi:hypothetical protein